MRVVRRLGRGAMNLAQSVQDSVQTGWSFFSSFRWLLLLIRSRAPESGINHCVIRALFLVLAFIFITPWLPVAIPYFGCAGVASAFAGEPAIFSRAKAGHKAC